MYYYGARYYDAKISIWASVDPLAEMFPGRSPYEYCFSNPINLTDPTGMSPDDGGGDPPKKNVYIVLDYKPHINKEGKLVDEKRDTIKFQGLEENGWHGIYASDLIDAASQLSNYLGTSMADNVVLETHGAILTIGGEDKYKERTLRVDNNNETYITNVDMYTQASGGERDNKSIYVDSLVAITNKVKMGGTFFINSCHTGENDYFASSLQTLTLDKVNIIVNIGTSIRYSEKGKLPGLAIYSSKYLFDTNLGGDEGLKVHEAASNNITTKKSVTLTKYGIFVNCQ